MRQLKGQDLQALVPRLRESAPVLWRFRRYLPKVAEHRRALPQSRDCRGSRVLAGRGERRFTDRAKDRHAFA